jgi:flagellar assembly protein FliH
LVKGALPEQWSEAKPWAAPEVALPDTAATRPAPAASPVTAGSIADLQAEAYREAYEEGLRQGIAAGQEKLSGEVHKLDGMLHDLARPFAELDRQVEHELLALAVALARQIVRRELKADPTQIIGVIRDALAALPVAARDVRVRMHPEDAAVVRQHLAPTESERAWQIVEDPVMARGGCEVVSATSRVDARIETRLAALLSELLGSERAANSPRASDPQRGQP